MNNLHGTCAVVTGAGKGIGRAISLTLLREGVNVSGISQTNADLESIALEAKELPGAFHGFSGDISDETIVQESIEHTIEMFGSIEHLVNNAGIGIMKPVQEFSVQEWDRVLNTNVRGTFLATRFTLPHMIKCKSGTIVNISSIAGKQAFAGGAAYCASKFAVMGFSDALMFDVRKYNIRVITICPGSVATRFQTRSDHLKDVDKILSPQDCADSVLYALKLPHRASAHQIELRITNP